MSTFYFVHILFCAGYYNFLLVHSICRIIIYNNKYMEGAIILPAKFTEIDEGFTCINCGKEVKPLGYTSRDHCPNCLYSLHVDVNPGDRLEDCQGILQPIGIERVKKGLQIIYVCRKCRRIRKNIVAKDDNMETIIRLSSNPVS